MGTNNFSVVVQKRITTTRPAANEILYHKHDGTTGIIVTLLTTGIVRLTINATTFDSTVALTSASNVEPVIIIPVVRETAAAAGSVTFVVDGVQLGSAVAVLARVELVTNGTFATDITGWTATNGAVLSWDATGKIEVTGGGAVFGAAAYQAISTVVGASYSITVECTQEGSDARVRIQTATATGSGVITSTTFSGAQTKTVGFVATTTTTYILLENNGTTGTSKFDNVTSIDTYSVDNASNLYLLGTSTTTTEGSYYDGAIYNRALSVTECLNYCLRGPEIGDVGATQTAVYTSDFSAGADSWTATNSSGDGNIDGIDGEDNCFRMTISTTGTGRRINRTITQLNIGQMVQITGRVYWPVTNVNFDSFTIANGAAGNIISPSAFVTNGTKGVWQSFSFIGPCLETTTSIRFYAGNTAPSTSSTTEAGDIMYLKDIQIKKVGITGHWPAFNAQTNTGQLADRSGNKNHMMLPASGATIIGDRRPDVQLTWDNTWAATSELQYFPGVNQACYPTNFYIEGIIITPSATTTAGFTIGNGSDADYYATVSGPLTAGVPVFVPLTNRYSDGTNLKLTITPMATTTCTLSTTVFGRLLGGF
jgi:hypothetical protein